MDEGDSRMKRIVLIQMMDPWRISVCSIKLQLIHVRDTGR